MYSDPELGQDQPQNVVSIPTKTTNDVYIDRVELYNQLSRISDSVTMSLGRPTQAGKIVRRGDILLTDFSVPIGSSETGSALIGGSQVHTFVSISGINVDLNPSGVPLPGRPTADATLACRQNQKLYWQDASGDEITTRPISANEQARLINIVVRERCAKLQFAGISLGGVRVGDGSMNDNNGVTSAVAGSCVAIRNTSGVYAKFNMLFSLRMPDKFWSSGGGVWDDTITDGAFDVYGRNDEAFGRPVLEVFNPQFTDDFSSMFAIDKKNVGKGYYRTTRGSIPDTTTADRMITTLTTSLTVISAQITNVETALGTAEATLATAVNRLRAATTPTKTLQDAVINAQNDRDRTRDTLRSLRLLEKSFEVDIATANAVKADIASQQYSSQSESLYTATDIVSASGTSTPKINDVIRGTIGRQLAAYRRAIVDASGNALIETIALGEFTNRISDEVLSLMASGFLDAVFPKDLVWYQLPVFRVVTEGAPGTFIKVLLLQ